ncbi:hypothetical protein [Roseiarcus sp.]|jgi:hypothetical protein|uniref:hypothetical protein n=1 Tax=Roseiarcus sp. TaxID=1969460 RepID=UPI003D146D60
MLKLTISGAEPRPPPEWREALARIRQLRLTEIAQDEEQQGLEAMLHWRDPIERLRTLRRRNHTLVDDNPASG